MKCLRQNVQPQRNVHVSNYIVADSDEESLHLHLSVSINEETEDEEEGETSNKNTYMTNMGLSPCIKDTGNVSNSDEMSRSSRPTPTLTPWLWKSFTRSEMYKLKEGHGKLHIS